MPISKEVLKAKAQGFMISIDKMDGRQRALSPDGDFGEDYNNLRKLVLEQYPDMSPVLPPAVNFFEGNDRQITRQSFGEINTYCEQLFQMLNAYNG